MSKIPIQIVRRKGKELVDAVLDTELTANVLVETEKEWGPIRRKIAKELEVAGDAAKVPQHSHWDWEKKSPRLGLLAYRSFGIKCASKLQGLLLISAAGKVARLMPDKGKELVYIEYLEVAPWNLPVVDNPEYGGVGSVLMRAAVEASHDEGFHGRIGLHALPQSEDFYRNKCGMQCCGPDSSVQGLPYYEMTRADALQFVKPQGE